jgi:hypothetical protein
MLERGTWVRMSKLSLVRMGSPSFGRPGCFYGRWKMSPWRVVFVEKGQIGRKERVSSQEEIGMTCCRYSIDKNTTLLRDRKSIGWKDIRE